MHSSKNVFINNRFKAIWGKCETSQQSPKLFITYMNYFPNWIYGKISYFCRFDSAQNQLLLIISNLHLKALIHLKAILSVIQTCWDGRKRFSLNRARVLLNTSVGCLCGPSTAVQELSPPDTAQVTDLSYPGQPRWTKHLQHIKSCPNAPLALVNLTLNNSALYLLQGAIKSSKDFQDSSKSTHSFVIQNMFEK